MRRCTLSFLLILVLGNSAIASPEVLDRIDHLWHSRRAPEAHALLDSILPDAQTHGDRALELQLLTRRGHMYVALGHGREAAPAAKAALDLAEVLADTSMIEANLRWLGVAYGISGRNAEAESLFVELVDLSRTTGNRESLAWGLVGLGYYDQQAERMESSRKKYEKAVEYFRACGLAQGELYALNGLGIAQFGAEARRSYQRSLALSRELGLIGSEALALNNLGVMEYGQGDPGLAMAYFEQARDLQELDGNLHEALLAEGNIRLCLVALGRSQEARRRLDTHLSICREQGFRDLELDAIQHLAALLHEADQEQAADSLCTLLFDVRDELPAKEQLELLILSSRIRSDLEGPAAGRTFLVDQTGWVQTLETPSLILRFNLELNRRVRESGDPATTFLNLEKLLSSPQSDGEPRIRMDLLIECARAAEDLGNVDRARELLFRAAEIWEAERSLPLDPDWREIRGSAGKEIYPDLARLILASTSGQPESSREEAFLVLQRYRSRTLLERLQGPGTPSRPPPDLDLHRLQTEVLQDGDLLLDFTFGRLGSLLFAVTRDRCRVLSLPSAQEIEPRLKLLAQLVAESGQVAGAAVLEPALSFQRDLLLGGAADLIAVARHIIVVPDGPLHSLPLALLLESGSSPVTRTPSAALLAELRARPRTRMTGAGYLFSPESKLAGSQRETTMLKRRYLGLEPGELGDVGLASPEIQGASLLHFAGHAMADAEHPWRSALLGPDLRVEAREIAAQNLAARLVVLSACESAGGRRLPGEGVQGLASAFIVAGVPVVLATLWPVDDAVSADLVLAFYDGLAEGYDAASALVDAQDLIRARPASMHPSYWAGFILIGDGAATLKLEKRPVSTTPRVILGVILACLGAWLLGAHFIHRRFSS